MKVIFFQNFDLEKTALNLAKVTAAASLSTARLDLFENSKIAGLYHTFLAGEHTEFAS